MAPRRIVLALLTLISLVQIVITQTGIDLKNLYDELMNKRKYQKVTPPYESLKEAITVRVAFHLHGINSLDDVEGKLATTAHLTLEWQDAFLTWNRKDFSNISYIYMPQNEVWKPDVSLNNGFTKLKELGDDVIQVTVMNTGKVIWNPMEVFETKCDINITKFPFDTQVCKLIFRLWTLQPQDVKFKLNEPVTLHLDTYEENSVWDLHSANIVLENGNFIVLLSLNRRPEYYLLTLICPIILLSLLDIFTFVIPVDSGEKMGYSMTAYLAFAVFLTIIRSSLPINSRTTSYLAVFVVSLLVKGTAIVVVTAVQVRLHHRRNDKDLPRCLRHFIRFSRWIRACFTTRVKPQTDNVNNQESNIDVHNSQHLPASKKESSKLPLDERSEDEEEEKNDMYTWANACAALDGFFFCFFFVAAFFMTIIFFCGISLNTASLY
ncbi:acetylcholine receptor subunit alpha-like [Ylistrum balloti]|uniref:acetylcholine receptor subunit alpha-like n=1 Tax=Ylistrum balloti TaxID=509963 RepID=UPI002905E3CF|nr:acetylcholine receptor subunit alpha-like [Ylistrum balloti]